MARAAGFDAQKVAQTGGVSPETVLDNTSSLIVPQQTAAADGYKLYPVQPGDTYSGIARKYSIGVSALMAANLIPPGALRQGDLVTIPSTDTKDTTELKTPNEKLSGFVKNYLPYAQKIEKKYDIPAAATLAQMMHETNYGESELFQNTFNIAGIKANDNWTGATYKHTTWEEENGQRVKVVDTFRKYATIEAGFEGYAAKLREGNYKDAFTDATKNNPYAFMKALVDNNGPKWATDSKYLQNMLPKIKSVEDAIAVIDKSNAPSSQPSIVEVHPGTEEPKVGNAEIARAIDQIDITPEGYELYKQGVVDLRSYAGQFTNFNPSLVGKELVPQGGDTQWIILHFTAVNYTAKDDRSLGEAFVTSMHNTKESRGQQMGAGVQYFTDRNGVTYQLANDTVRLAQAGNRFNAGAVGMEVEAEYIEGVNPEQYRQAIYWLAHTLEASGKISKDKPVSRKYLKSVVVGHGELNETHPDSESTHSDFSNKDKLMDQIRHKLYSLLAQQGYTLVA